MNNYQSLLPPVNERIRKLGDQIDELLQTGLGIDEQEWHDQLCNRLTMIEILELIGESCKESMQSPKNDGISEREVA